MITHTPEDMTASVSADAMLTELQAALAKAGQWLPLDPPNPNLTLRETLDRNESGPRCFGYGTARDYVIGLKVALADGRIVKSGGQVVKNVAGYDLQKLFIGAGGTLGTIREATFKLRPLPETEKFVQQKFDSLDAIGATVEAVFDSELTPVVSDLHRGVQRVDGNAFVLVLGFDGAKEDVDWQLALAAKFGFKEDATLDYDKTFCADTKPLRKVSVLPSKLVETLRGLDDEPFVARAGNGIIFRRVGAGEVSRHSPLITRHLHRRVKDEFDPKHLLPELPA